LTKGWEQKEKKESPFDWFQKAECAFDHEWTHNYILERFRVTIRSTINKNMENEKP